MEKNRSPKSVPIFTVKFNILKYYIFFMQTGSKSKKNHVTQTSVTVFGSNSIFNKFWGGFLKIF